MLFLYLVLSLDKTIEGINSILPIVSYRNISLSELRMSVHEISLLESKPWGWNSFIASSGYSGMSWSSWSSWSRISILL